MPEFKWWTQARANRFTRSVRASCFCLLPNAKLFTSALALEKLGADYRFTTKVVLAPSGDLVLLGGGDPSLSGRVYPYSKEQRDKKAAPLQLPADVQRQGRSYARRLGYCR
jgi:D-Ala-D-Ala carboxypeptidase 3 (S13) family